MTMLVSTGATCSHEEGGNVHVQLVRVMYLAMRFDARLRAAAVPFSLRTVREAPRIELRNSSYKCSRHKLTHNRQHSFRTVSIAYLVHPRKLRQCGS